MKKKKIIIVGSFFSLFFIVLIVYYVDFNNVIIALAKFRIKYVLILLIVYMISMVSRSLRWFLLINHRDEVKFKDTFNGLVLGYMANNLLPVKLGEFVRIIYLSKIYKSSKSFLLGTVVIERLFDIIVVCLFLLFSVFFSKTIQDIIGHKIIILLVLLSILSGACYFIVKTKLIFNMINIFPKRVSEKMHQIFQSFSSAFIFVNSRFALLKVCLLSLIIWLLTCVMCFTILYGLNVEIPFYAYFFVVSVGVLGMIIPSTSGGIGVYHAVSMGSLLLFGINKDIALTYAIISHAFDFIPNVILGLAILIKNNYSLLTLSKEVESI